MSPTLSDSYLETTGLKLNLLVADPSGLYETGDTVSWSNNLVLRTEEVKSKEGRKIALYVAPRGTIRYTTNGSEPREGTPYTEPFLIEDGEVLVRAFADSRGTQRCIREERLSFPALGKSGVQMIR